ncbi:MAG TPA: HeH/LEM domain-containing protein [Methylophilaceae bacterium]|nr:HeH/LEM domain-containing protein [Methylophilaceae bacterium]
MQKFEITATATFNPGTKLQLTKEQAAPRLHNLNDLGKGVYAVVRRVQFKVGEVIGHEGELPKSFASLVEASASGTSGTSGPTVDDLKKALTEKGIDFPKKANKGELQKLLEEAEKAAADKAAAIKAKALEMNELEEADFNALPPAEQDKLLADAEEALGK